MSSDRTPLAAALGRICSGLYIATAEIDGAPFGMLCSFVEQAAFAPPMISIAMAHGRPIVAALEGDGRFGLHILSKSNDALLKTFARGSSPDAFVRHPLVENRFGVPQLAEAWVFLACKVTGSIAAGDHTVYLSEVLDGMLQHEGQEAMTRIRTNGFGY